MCSDNNWNRVHTDEGGVEGRGGGVEGRGGGVSCHACKATNLVLGLEGAGDCFV